MVINHCSRLTTILELYTAFLFFTPFASVYMETISNNDEPQKKSLPNSTIQERLVGEEGEAVQENCLIV